MVSQSIKTFSKRKEHAHENSQSLKLSITNGSLYANQDRIFPPTMSMQLHALRYKNSENIQSNEEELELSFSLDARPLPVDGPDDMTGVVRVSMEVLNVQGEPVTLNAVALDLLSDDDGSYHITRIRIIPGQAHPDYLSPDDRRPWHMKFWRSQVGSVFKHSEDTQPSSSTSDAPHTKDDVALSHSANTADSSISSAVDSWVGHFYSPNAVPGTDSHNSHRHLHEGHHQRHKLMRLIHPVILPAVLGIVAGLAACLIGFVIGHVFMSLSNCLGFNQKPRRRRTRTFCVEDGALSEKSDLMLPEIYVTELSPE